ncbi:MAG: histidinol-phosphate transaminase [Treponema sp.]|nr:histidinol-phosphate transaminase [Treponema sp.]
MLAKRLQNLHPYVPGEQPNDREYIKLNANENPYSPHQSVSQAVQDAAVNLPQKMGLYPDPDVTQLREEIAAMLNKTGGSFWSAECSGSEPESDCKPAPQNKLPFTVTSDMIFCGNGSDEVLSFVFYTFFDSDRPLIMPQFTYSFYPVYCGYYDIPMKQIALNADWSLDTETMLTEANKTDSSIIFANPNAPTGIALSREAVRKMLQRAPKDRVFIVDEAYCDFGGESCIPLLAEFDNLVIVRTFSKSLSLAGMRLGYIVSSPDLVKAVFQVKNSFNHFPVDFIAQTAAKASCKATPYYVQNAKQIAQERDSFTAFLREHGWFVIDSATNFVFAKKKGLAGRDVYEAVKKQGILIRHFATPGIEDFVRITIGTPQQMAQLKTIMEAL